MVKVVCELDIPAARIADLMTTAIESGYSRYWCAGVYLREVNGRPFRVNATKQNAEWGNPEYPGLWYTAASLYDGTRTVRIEIVEYDESDGTKKSHYVDESAFVKTLSLMAAKYGNHFRDFAEENDDAETADVFLQLLALGDVVYG